MMFYLTDSQGAVTGPHTAGVVMRRLDAGEMTWDDPVCAHGTEDWVPAITYQDDIDSRGREQRTAAERNRHLQSMILAQSAGQSDTRKKSADAAFAVGLCCFLLGLVLPFMGMILACWITSIICIVCGCLAIVNGGIGRGICCFAFGLLTMPLLLVVVFPLK